MFVSTAASHLDELHQYLCKRFDSQADLSGKRLGYIFEHGLPNAERASLLASVRAGLRRFPVADSWWRCRYFPLLVAATELGYGYRGTGTDFWPTFGSSLGVVAGHADRQELSALYRQACARHGLAVPSATPWNLHFCHIAWPILHSIMPRELHRPFALCLNDIRSRLDLERDDETLIAPLRSRARLRTGTRLLAWLETPQPAAAITRFFLGGAAGTELDETALKRIADDLAKDDAAQTAVRAARQKQKALAAAPAPKPRAREPEVHPAPLALRRVDEAWSLALKLPQMEEALRAATREALDVIRWRAPLFGQGRPVAARNLFSDEPLQLPSTALPSPSTPVLAGLEDLPIRAEARSFLGSLRVGTAPPLLFADADEDGYHHQLLSRSATAGGSYLLLLAAEAPAAPAEAERIGTVAGHRVLRVDAARPGLCAWLGALGIGVREAASFAWIGDPEREQHRPIRRFPLGSTLAFETAMPSGRSHDVTLVVPDGSRAAVAAPDGRVMAAFTPRLIGRHAIEYGAGETMPFDVIDPLEGEPLLTVHLEAGLGSISELAAGEATLRFESVGSVQEEVLELTLLSGDREIARAATTLPDTPCRVTGNHPVWEDLLGAGAKAHLLEAETVELQVRVGRIGGERFSFERVSAPFEWRWNDRDRWEAHDEAGEMPVLQTSAENPLDGEAHRPALSPPDILLLRAGHGEPSESGGLCIGPKVWRSGAAPAIVRPDRLPRRLDSPEKSAPGAWKVVDALIAWSAAGVDHPVTEYRRGQVLAALRSWAVEQFCGPTWSAREAALGAGRAPGFIEAFLRECEQRGVGFQRVALTAGQQGQLRRILLRLIADRLAEAARLPSSEPATDALAETLDGIFNDAYAFLADELGGACPFDVDEDIDAGATAEIWDGVLGAARRASLIPELVDLLRPLGAGDELMKVEFESLAPDEAIRLLAAWIGRRRPPQLARAWSAELVEASYWILSKPALAGRFPWRAAAERLLADRFTARALRYAALRAGATAEHNA